MSLKVAVQMDPLESINIEGDSTFAIMLGAQARGHRLFHYAAEALSWHEAAGCGRMAHPVTVQRVAGDHYRFGEPEILDLGRDADVVLMRQDPPFDLGYITATHLLERIQGETLVVNDPAAVRNAPEKVWVLDYARFMPPTLITRSLGVARKFLAEHEEIVVKPLHGNGGKAVFKVGSDGANLASLIEVFNTAYREPHVVQAFLPGVAEGRQAHRPRRRRGRGRGQPHPRRGRDPLQPRRRRQGGEDRADRRARRRFAPRSAPS